MNILPRHDHYEVKLDKWAATYWCILIAVLIVVLVIFNRQQDLIDKVDRVKDRQQVINDRLEVETPWVIRNGKVELE